MDDKKVIFERMLIAGLNTRTINSDEMNPQTATIAPLWKLFNDNNVAAAIPNKVQDNLIVATYSDYESDHTGAYTCTIGCPVVEKPESSELNTVTIPATTYLRFDVTGEMPHAVFSTWQQIWEYFALQDCPYERAYDVDFEWYDMKNNDFYIYIGIRD